MGHSSPGYRTLDILPPNFSSIALTIGSCSNFARNSDCFDTALRLASSLTHTRNCCPSTCANTVRNFSIGSFACNISAMLRLSAGKIRCSSPLCVCHAATESSIDAKNRELATPARIADTCASVRSVIASVGVNSTAFGALNSGAFASAGLDSAAAGADSFGASDSASFMRGVLTGSDFAALANGFAAAAGGGGIGAPNPLGLLNAGALIDAFAVGAATFDGAIGDGGTLAVPNPIDFEVNGDAV